jgi:hypothetical protein
MVRREDRRLEGEVAHRQKEAGEARCRAEVVAHRQTVAAVGNPFMFPWISKQSGVGKATTRGQRDQNDALLARSKKTYGLRIALIAAVVLGLVERGSVLVDDGLCFLPLFPYDSEQILGERLGTLDLFWVRATER